MRLVVAFGAIENGSCGIWYKLNSLLQELIRSLAFTVRISYGTSHCMLLFVAESMKESTLALPHRWHLIRRRLYYIVELHLSGKSLLSHLRGAKVLIVRFVVTCSSLCNALRFHFLMALWQILESHLL
jgi:hypothetical protein